MANLSNINNKFLFTDGDFLKIGNSAPINNISGTESGISITNGNCASITLDNSAAQGKTFSIYSAVNGSLNFFDVDANSGRLVINSSGNATFAGEVTLSAETQYLNFKKASTADIIASIIAQTDAGTGGKLRFLTKRNGDTQLDALVIDDNQNVAIGNTVANGFGSDTVLAVYNATTPRIKLQNSTTGTANTDGGELNMSGSDFIIENREAGNIKIFNNGSERIRVDSSGNASFSSNNVDIKGPSAGNTQIRIANSTGTIGTNSFDLINDGSAAYVWNRAQTDLNFATYGSLRMKIRASGCVGIGTSGFDSQKLAIDAGILDGAIYATSSDANCVASFRDNSSTANIEFGAQGNSHIFRKDASIKMVIDGDGDVGIGVTTPHSALQVKGSVNNLVAHFGGQNNTNGNWNGISLGYAEDANASYRKVGIIAEARGDGAARQNLHFLVDTNADGNSAGLADSKMMIDGLTGNVGIGTVSPGDAKLYVNGGTTLGGTNNNSAGAIRMFGDRKLPQANNFVKRNYTLQAGASGALYSIARQWHDHANWGLGNINVIMWGVSYGHNNFGKADFSCKYGYSGGTASVQANFNPGGLAIPAWTSATQVSGNIHYRDLQIQIPAYLQISFEIISPGLAQTYNLSNTAQNTVYLYPH